MSIESHINLAIGSIQEAERDAIDHHGVNVSARHFKKAVELLNCAREELRSLRAQINKIEANL